MKTVKKITVITLAIIIILFCALTWGALSVETGLFPGSQLETVSNKIIALTSQESANEDKTSTIWFDDAYPDNSGVRTHNDIKTLDGLTAYTTTGSTDIKIINMDGLVRHTLVLPYQKLFSDEDVEGNGLDIDIDGDHFYIRDFSFDKDGQITLLYQRENSEQIGAGIARVDRQGKKIWSRAGYFVNDIVVSPSEQRTYAIEFVPVYNKIDNVYDDTQYTLTILNDQGSVEKRINLSKLAKAHNLDLKKINISSLQRLGAIPSISWAKEGHILVSLNDLGAFAVIDPVNEKITHLSYLPSRGQNDVRLDNQNSIALFDNFGSLDGIGQSRILRIHPNSQTLQWSYSGSSKLPLNVSRYGSQQTLSNRNTLVSTGEQGRIFEVTPYKEVVWDYYLTERDPDTRLRVPAVTHAQRLSKAEADALSPSKK